MPTYKGTFTNKSGTYLIEVFNDFDDFHLEIAQFKFSGNDLDGLALENLSELSSAEKLFDMEKIKSLCKAHKMLKKAPNTLQSPAVYIEQMAGGYTKIIFGNGQTIEG